MSDAEDSDFEDPENQEEEVEEEELEEEEEQDDPPFALNPAQATGALTLNYRDKKSHRSHYDAATKSLYPQAGKRFDLTQDRLHELLAKIRLRGKAFSFSTMEVPIDLNDLLGATHNLASGHGQITHAHLRAFAQTFLTNNSRATQDDYMLFTTLFESCDEDAQSELADYEDDHTVNGRVCGVLLLEVIMRESSVEVSTDPDLIRQELATMHLKFKELQFDVTELNKWVKRKIKQLRASGETSTDLRTHLFKAYRSSPDKGFTDYIKSIKDDVRDKKLELSAKELMSMAKLKVKDMERERQLDAADGANSKDEQLLALQARVDSLARRVNSGGDPRRRPLRPGNMQKPPGKGKRGSKKPPPFPKQLKTAGPPANPQQPRVIDGISYFYCEHHKKWGKHPTHKCEAKRAATNSRTSNGGDTSRLARAARAIAAVAVGGDE